MSPAIYEVIKTYDDGRKLIVSKYAGKRGARVIIESPHHSTSGISFVSILFCRICKNINEARMIAATM